MQITVVMCGSLDGELLPMQLIYGGKTKRCHSAYQFPDVWLTSHTHNEDTMIEYVRNVIVPFVKCSVGWLVPCTGYIWSFQRLINAKRHNWTGRKSHPLCVASHSICWIAAANGYICHQGSQDEISFQIGMQMNWQSCLMTMRVPLLIFPLQE